MALGSVAAASAGSPARADSLTLLATGTIPSGCSVGKSADFAQNNNFSVSGGASAGANVDCNTPFLIRAVSAKGAIKTSGAASAGFTNSVPYAFGLSVQLQGNGGPATVNCTSAVMAANNCLLSSGNKTANRKTGTLTVQWQAPPAQTALVAGTYSDTITLSIAAQP